MYGSPTITNSIIWSILPWPISPIQPLPERAAPNRDFSTLKYDPMGNEIWTARYDGPLHSIDAANDLALDSAGNVYATGTSLGAIGDAGDYATIKYDAHGNQLWSARYDGGHSDYARSMALDAQGNTHVTGYSYNGNGSGFNYATVKYDTYGNELWRVLHGDPDQTSRDRARAIVIDDAGNVYVTGNGFVDIGIDDYLTVKYDASGNELWAARYNGPDNGSDSAWSLTVDASGNVYVTGSSYMEATKSDYATIKYDPDGNQLWTARFDGSAGQLKDYACSIAVDSAGNVYVTGYSEKDMPDEDYATVKYDPDGNQLWVAEYDGPAGGRDRASSLLLDAAGNIYVTGVTGLSTGTETGSDYATVKYDPDGNELWVALYDGPASDDDEANAVAVDSEGNVYVTGGASNLPRSPAVITSSLVQGGWPGEGNIDADPLFVDPDGADDVTGTLDDDFRLNEGSPCIDAGDNAAPELPARDLDGNPRVADGNGDIVAVVDMGAYEVQPPPWGAASTVPSAGKKGLSDPVNALFFLFVPAGAWLLLRGIRKRGSLV